MGKESNLLKKVGTKNPFNVPDQYFENFTRELMNQLPEKENIPTMPELTLWQRVKPWVYMAAMFVGIMLSVRVFVGAPQSEEEFPFSQTEAENIPNEEWENVIRRAFIDDYETYQFLTEAEK